MHICLLSILSAAALEVSGSPPFPPLPDSVSLETSAVEQLTAGVLDWYLSRGYPFAAVALYPSSRDTLVVHTVPGRHALLEEVVFPDTVRTRASVLLRGLETECGEPYSYQDVELWLESLDRLPFVESAGPCGVHLGSGGNIVLVVPVEESPPGWFSGDLDFTSSGGFTGGGEIVFTNIFGTGRRLELRGAAVQWGGLDASALYREPWILGSPVSAEFAASQEVPDSGSVIRELSGNLLMGIGPLEVSGGGGSWSSYPAQGGDESYRYASAGLSWDLTKRVPQGRAGFSGRVNTDAGTASGTDSTYFLTRADGAMKYQWFRSAVGLGASVMAGGTLGGVRPSTMVTRLGGYGSIRGYPEDTWRAAEWGVISPEISLGETATRLYAFLDAGILRTGEGVMEYPVSAGAGIRGVSGGLGFDAGAGYPLDRGVESARFYLSARVSI